MKNNKWVIEKNGMYFKRHIMDGMNHYVRNIKEAKKYKSLDDLYWDRIRYKIDKMTIKDVI